MNQKFKKHEEKLIPDPGLLRVLRGTTDGCRLLIRFGGASDVPDLAKPAAGVCALLVGENVTEDSEDVGCSEKGCTWIGPAHHMTCHLRECKRTLRTLAFFKGKLPEVAVENENMEKLSDCSTRGSLLIGVSWWNGAQPAELQLHLQHPCGKLCSMEPGDCSHCEGHIWSPQLGGAFQSCAVGASWAQDEVPPNGRYTVIVLQSSGPPVSLSVVIAIGSTFTRIVTARGAGEGSEVSPCSFQLPFEGNLIHPVEHPSTSQMKCYPACAPCFPGSTLVPIPSCACVRGQETPKGKGSEVSSLLPFEGNLIHPVEHPATSQMASEWWAVASDGQSGAVKEGVVSASGWVMVSQDAPEFQIRPPPDEPGLLPVVVKRSDITQVAPGFLMTSFPLDSRLLRVLQKAKLPKIRYRLCFGGLAALPPGWVIAAHVKVEAVLESYESDSEDDRTDVPESFRTDHGGWCWVPSGAEVLRIHPPDGQHLKFHPVEVEREEMEPVLELDLEPKLKCKH